MTTAVRAIKPPPVKDRNDPPWSGHVLRAHLPHMTETEVRECLADGRMDHLLGGNCAFVMFPQRKAHDGGPDIRPVSYHNAEGMPVVDGIAANDYGTWIPLGTTVLVNNQNARQVWPLPLDSVDQQKLRTGKATIVCPHTKYALHN